MDNSKCVLVLTSTTTPCGAKRHDLDTGVVTVPKMGYHFTWEWSPALFTLEDAEAWMLSQTSKPYSFPVHGRPTKDWPADSVNYRRMKTKTVDGAVQPATLRDRTMEWCFVDVDKALRLAGETFEMAVRRLGVEILGRAVGFIALGSASYVEGSDTISVRFMVPLAAKRTCKDLLAHFEPRGVDTRIYTPIQPVYLASPVCLSGGKVTDNAGPTRPLLRVDGNALEVVNLLARGTRSSSQAAEKPRKRRGQTKKPVAKGERASRKTALAEEEIEGGNEDGVDIGEVLRDSEQPEDFKRTLGVFTDDGMVKSVNSDGHYNVDCPWREFHTQPEHGGAPEGETTTQLMPATTLMPWGFKCLRAHCKDRDRGDVVEWVTARLVEHVKEALPEGTFAVTPSLSEALPGGVFSKEEATIDGDLLDRNDPLTTARFFLPLMPPTRYYQGEFYVYTGSHYVVLTEDKLKADLYAFLETKMAQLTNFVDRFKPTRARVNEVREALAGLVLLDTQHQIPCWLHEGPHALRPSDIVACGNGLLHLPTRELLPATPEFFALNALPFDYDPEAEPPEEWLAFLDDLWGEDPESLSALQELFGYYISADTSFQKIGLVYGPTRAGKGVIGTVLKYMVGLNNTTSPSLNALAGNFGTEPLIGKRLCLIPDARLSMRFNLSAVTEKLLAVSGGDNPNISRKNRTDWHGPLGVRFLLMTNELPKLLDDSAALIGRLILLRLTKSFYGKEDLGLAKRLLGSLPGVFNWALDGLARLRERGHFQQPESGKELIEDMREAASPVGAFVRRHCEVGEPGYSVNADNLYAMWRADCGVYGARDYGISEFGRQLRAAVPGIRKTRPWAKGRRPSVYTGIRLLEESGETTPKPKGEVVPLRPEEPSE